MAGGDPDGGSGNTPDHEINTDETAGPDVSTGQDPSTVALRRAAASTVGVLAVLLLAYFIYTVRAILVLVLIGLFIAISFDPAVRWLVHRRLPRPIAVTIVVLGVIGLFAVSVWSIAPPLVAQGSKLFSDLPGYLGQLSEKSTPVHAITERYHLTERLADFVSQLPAKLAGGAFDFVRRFIGAVGSTLTVLVLSIYFMADMPRLRRGIVSLFPARRRPRVAQIVDVVVDKVGGYMIGNIAISVLAGTSTFVCLKLVGVPFALPLALTMAIADMIPMIGATLGAVICTAVTALTLDIWPAAVIVLAFIIAYQQVENYLIAPRVYRNAMQMPSGAVLLVALIGGSVLGLVGALMAIPIAATVKVIMSPTIPARREPVPPASDD